MHLALRGQQLGCAADFRPVRRKGADLIGVPIPRDAAMSYLIWDFDGTLAVRRDGWAGALSEVANEHAPDLGVRPDALRPHLRSGFPWQKPSWIRQAASPNAWWSGLQEIFANAYAKIGVPGETARQMADNVRETYLEFGSWSVFDDVPPTLEELRDIGWKHVILSNHVPELSALVEGLGLRQHFEAIFSSALTGKEKPNRAAFIEVLEAYPGSSSGWMIGDSWETDIAGAAQVGLRAVLVRNPHPQGGVLYSDLTEIVSHVGTPG